MVDYFDFYQATAMVYAARLGLNVKLCKLRNHRKIIFFKIGCAKTVHFLMPHSKLNVIDIFGKSVSNRFKF
jgi:hypothetical protein